VRRADPPRPDARRGAGPLRARPDRGVRPPGGRRRAAAGGRTGLRPGQGVHPAVPVRVAQPVGDVRPEAGRPGRGPRRARRDPLGRAGPGRLRAPAAPGPGDGQGQRRPLGDAPVPDPRRRLRHDRHPPDRAVDGAQPEGRGALAVHRLGRRSPRRPARPDAGRGAGSAPQPRPALVLQQPARRRGGPRRALRRLPRPDVRPGLHRVRRPGDPHGDEDPPGEDLGGPRTLPGRHAGEPVPALERLGPAPGADARPPRPPPLAAGAVRTGAAGPRRGRRALRDRPPPGDGLRAAGLRPAPPGVRPRGGIAADPRELRHDPLRPGHADGPAPGRGGGAGSSPSSGTSMAWPAPAGIPTGTTTPA
jgi:hypothetical protein